MSTAERVDVASLLNGKVETGADVTVRGWVRTRRDSKAGLSFLQIGIKAPTASWGSLLETGPDYYLTQPWLMVWPGLAILLTTLAFNLLGDGLRDAFDPRSSH